MDLGNQLWEQRPVFWENPGGALQPEVEASPWALGHRHPPTGWGQWEARVEGEGAQARQARNLKTVAVEEMKGEVMGKFVGGEGGALVERGEAEKGELAE